MRFKDKFLLPSQDRNQIAQETVINISAGEFPDLFNVNLGISDIPGYIWFYIILYVISALIGTCGNTLIIFITIYSKKLRNIRNAFIVNLSTADLLVSSVIMPASIIGILFGKKWHDERQILCLFTSVICAPGCVVSLYSIAWIAISRYYYIVKFSVYNKYFTTTRVICYIIGIWCLGFAVHIPNHFGWGKVRYSFMVRYCSLDTDEFSYAIFYATTLFSAVIIAFIFYLKIYLVIRKTNLSKSLILGTKQKSYETDTKTDKKVLRDELKILKATFKIFILFVLAWLPATFILFLSMGEQIAPWVYLYSGMLSHVNSTLNFFVYFFGNRIFQSAVKESFGRFFYCLNIKPSSKTASNMILMERKMQLSLTEDITTV